MSKIRHIDDYDTGRITFKVRGVSVWQGVDLAEPFVTVQASGSVLRDPRLRNPTDADYEREYQFAVRWGSDAQVGTDEKFCIECGDVRAKTMFSPDKRSRDGLHVYCKECRNKRERLRYAQAKDYQQAA